MPKDDVIKHHRIRQVTTKQPHRYNLHYQQINRIRKAKTYFIELKPTKTL